MNFISFIEAIKNSNGNISSDEDLKDLQSEISQENISKIDNEEFQN